MAFLFGTRIRAHGTTKPAPDGAGPATVLFHPDFNRRLRNCTESADPSSQARQEGARGLGPRRNGALTAGGDFHPALRTSAVRYERPEANYDQRQTAGQGASAWGTGILPMPSARAL